MDLERVRESLANVIVTSVTQFTSDGIDERAVRNQARFLVDNGIRVVVPCGNTGEFFAMTVDECKRVTEATVAAVADRGTVIAGTGMGLPTALELGRHAQAVGAHAVMVHHPIFTYLTEQGMYRYLATIADTLEIGVILYKRGPELSDDVISRLVSHDNVIGVKYAYNAVEAFSHIVHSTAGADVVWACGIAERFAPFFHLAGARGFTSGIANFAPKLALALFDALAQGNWGKAMKLREKIRPFEQLRAKNNNGNNVSAVKEAMNQLGLNGGPVREPLVPLDEKDKSEVTRILKDWGHLDADGKVISLANAR